MLLPCVRGRIIGSSAVGVAIEHGLGTGSFNGSVDYDGARIKHLNLMCTLVSMPFEKVQILWYSNLVVVAQVPG